MNTKRLAVLAFVALSALAVIKSGKHVAKTGETAMVQIDDARMSAVDRAMGR